MNVNGSVFTVIVSTGEITAEMTAVRGDIPIKNFEDVIHHGYKVVTNSDFYRDLLRISAPDTAKHQVYKMHLEGKENKLLS